MEKLISKIQPKTYEKGEFSDEKARTLEETIDLIKNFPWDKERALTDIQLTGPSVTIQDDALNYLKLGLYFGGKFCVYYLDDQNHLFEHHTQNVDDALELIKHFFAGTLDITPFEKHLFNIGNQPHFLTNTFEYRVKSWQIAIFFGLLSLYIIILGICLSGSVGDPTRLTMFFFVLILGGLVVLIFSQVVIYRTAYLQISRGNDIFSFGEQADINTYNKRDIEKIIISDNSGHTASGKTATKLQLKDGSVLNIPNMLIQQYDLLSKFPNELKIPVIYRETSIFGTKDFQSNV